MLSFFAVSIYPAAFANAPQWAQPLVGSPLALVALSLNLLFRIGIRRKVGTRILPEAPYVWPAATALRCAAQREIQVHMAFLAPALCF